MTPTVVASAVTGAAPPANSFKIYVNSLFGLKRGEIVSGLSAVPSSTMVNEVGTDAGGNYIRLSNATTALISVASQFNATLTAYLLQPASSASPILQFASTTDKRLLLFRGLSSSSTGFGGSNSSPWMQQTVGLPLIYTNGGNASVDGINYPANITNATGWGFPNGGSYLLGVMFHSTRRGINVMVPGDSHICGTGSNSGDGNYVQLAGASLSTPILPVSVFQSCYGGTSYGQYDWFAEQFIQLGIVSVMVIPSSTFNTSASPANSLGAAGQLARTLEKQNEGVTILEGDWVRQAPGIFPAVVAAPVNNSTLVPILTYYHNNFTGAAVNGLQAGSGLLAGTTASYAVPSNNTCGSTALSSTVPLTYTGAYCSELVLNQPATLSKGEVLRLDQLVIASNTSGSTAATATTPAPFTDSTLTYASGGTLAVTRPRR